MKVRTNLNRRQLLYQFYHEILHNVICYSEDALMTKPKAEYREQWYEEQEKLEIIQEIIEEENENNFHLNTSIYRLANGIEDRKNLELACLQDRENGISCYLILMGNDDFRNSKFELVFNIHRRDKFYDEYENVYSRNINEEALKSRKTLETEMQKGLDMFKNFIEIDKKGNRFYSKFYENEETEEFE